MPERQHAAWGELLREAVEKPGRMLEAYTAFHNFSLCSPKMTAISCRSREAVRPNDPEKRSGAEEK
jgi:hypothetical protein